MIFGVLSLFVAMPIRSWCLEKPCTVAIFIAFVAGIVIAGTYSRARSVFARHALLRRQLGHHLWCIKGSAEKKIKHNIVSIASMPEAQLARYFGEEQAQTGMYLGYAFRA